MFKGMPKVQRFVMFALIGWFTVTILCAAGYVADFHRAGITVNRSLLTFNRALQFTKATTAINDVTCTGTLKMYGLAAPIATARYSASITSPTTTFSVLKATTDQLSWITLNSDQNITGCYPTDGVEGQVIFLVTGAGSNTIRFDDSAASMTIGGNVTVTEAQNDVLVLMCTKAPDEWTCLWAHDN